MPKYPSDSGYRQAARSIVTQGIPLDKYKDEKSSEGMQPSFSAIDHKSLQTRTEGEERHERRKGNDAKTASNIIITDSKAIQIRIQMN